MGLFSKIFGSKDNSFDKICVDKEVLESVVYYAKEAYPHEFLSMFDGIIKNHILYITGLIFIPGETSDTGAVLHYDQIPPNTKYYGTVHSHPGPSAEPSDADLMTFSKRGVFHMILRLPYSLQTFKAYDSSGNPIDYTIGDYSDIRNDELNLDEFFDEDDILKDGETFSDEAEKFLDDIEDNPKNYDDFDKLYKETDYIPSEVINPIVIGPDDLDENNSIVIDAEDAKRGISINLEPGMPIPKIIIRDKKDGDN